MKRYFLLLLPAILILGSCSTAEAEKVADEFHAKFDNNEIDYIVDNMIDSHATDEELEGFRNFLNGVRSNGKPSNREKATGFSKKMNNGLTTVKLNYTFDLEGEEVHEGLVLIDRGEGAGYKIMIISMSPDKDVVNQFTEGF